MAEAAGVEPARPCGTHGFRERPPRQWGLRFHGSMAESGAPRWIRTSNLRVLSAAPLPIGLQGQLWDGDGRCALGTRGRPLSLNSVSAYLVGIGSRIGPCGAI